MNKRLARAAGLAALLGMAAHASPLPYVHEYVLAQGMAPIGTGNCSSATASCVVASVTSSGAISGTTGAFSGTVANSGTGVGFTSAAASGTNGFANTTNGARIDFGAGASDYASSDGTTVAFAGPISAASSINVASNGYQIGGNYAVLEGGAAGFGSLAVYLRSSIAAATASSTVPAFGAFTLNAMDANDLMWAVKTGAAGAGGNVATIDYEGDLSAASLKTNTGQAMTKVFSASAVIDFGSTTITCGDSTGITVTGVVANDACFVGVPTTGGSNNGTYSCYVSAADTVKVRHCAAGTADDPGSATFYVRVISAQ